MTEIVSLPTPAPAGTGTTTPEAAPASPPEAFAALLVAALATVTHVEPAPEVAVEPETEAGAEPTPQGIAESAAAVPTTPAAVAGAVPPMSVVGPQSSPDAVTPADVPARAVVPEPAAAPSVGRMAPLTEVPDVAGLRAGGRPQPVTAEGVTTPTSKVPLDTMPDRKASIAGAAPEVSHPTPTGRTVTGREAVPPVPTTDVGPAAPVTAPAGAAVPSHDLHGRMLGRVMDALDVLENAPPPRRMTVELPDADGLRLHVSIRGSEVQVSVLGGSGATDTAGWTRDLSSALEARGFSLGDAGAGDRRGRPRDERPTPSPAPPARPAAPRGAADTGLRL